jgi:hypothetical protein
LAIQTTNNAATMMLLWQLVLSLLMTLHLLAVGVAGWLPVACLLLERRSAAGDEFAGNLSRRLALHAQALLFAGILIGVIIIGLGVWQRGAAYLGLFATVPARRLWFGLAELVFFFVCMAAYRASWDWFAGRRFWHRALALLAASNLLYHFPPLFTVMTTLATQPQLRNRAFRFLDLLLEREILTRTLHHWLAGMAAASVYVAWTASRARAAAPATYDCPGPCARDRNRRTDVAILASRWALLAAGLQFPVGAYLVVVMPGLQRGALLGGDPMAAVLFVAALLAALGLMHHLAAFSIAGGTLADARRCAWLTTLTVLMMVVARQRTRADAVPPGAAIRSAANACSLIGRRISRFLNDPQSLARRHPLVLGDQHLGQDSAGRSGQINRDDAAGDFDQAVASDHFDARLDQPHADGHRQFAQTQVGHEQVMSQGWHRVRCS